MLLCFFAHPSVDPAKIPQETVGNFRQRIKHLIEKRGDPLKINSLKLFLVS